MEFIISSTEINEVITKMGKILTTRTTIPVLAGVLIEVQANCILFTASDGSNSVIHRILITDDDESQIITEGRSVFIKEMFDVAKKMKGLIRFLANESTVTLKQDKTNLEFPIMDATDYPKIDVGGGTPLTLSGPAFEEMVSKTTFATAKSETRPILQGVNMSFTKESIVIVATDSHRLSRYAMPGTSDEEYSLSVPASILDQAIKSFDLKQDITIFSNKQSIALNNGNTFLLSTLLEGNYPDTSRLIPTDFESHLDLNRKELVEALELLQAITVGKSNVVVLKFAGLFVELSGAGEVGKGTKELLYEAYDGADDFSIGFSIQYTLDVLKRMDEPSVRFSFTGAMRPFIIVPSSGESNSLQLILPVRQY